MTVIENDGETMLVRLTRAECEALVRHIDGRKPIGEQGSLLAGIHSDLQRIGITGSAPIQHDRN